MEREKEREGEKDGKEVPSWFWPLAPFRNEKELMRKAHFSS